jgi:hypothetical protein
MDSPPAATIRLGASWWYRAAVCLATVLLAVGFVTLHSASNPSVTTATALAWGAAGLAAVCAWWDAWRPQQGALHYAAGDWVLARNGNETVGTLRVAMDLNVYLLVKFIPQDARLHNYSINMPQSPAIWLHLEPRNGRGAPHPTHATLRAADWLALRRAVFA